MIIINVEERPIKSRNISYSTGRKYSDGGENICLYEIVEYTYIHPQSEGSATISDIDCKLIKEINIHQEEAAPLLLLEAALNNIKEFRNKYDRV